MERGISEELIFIDQEMDSCVPHVHGLLKDNIVALQTRSTCRLYSSVQLVIIIGARNLQFDCSNVICARQACLSLK